MAHEEKQMVSAATKQARVPTQCCHCCAPTKAEKRTFGTGGVSKPHLLDLDFGGHYPMQKVTKPCNIVDRPWILEGACRDLLESPLLRLPLLLLRQGQLKTKGVAKKEMKKLAGDSIAEARQQLIEIALGTKAQESLAAETRLQLTLHGFAYLPDDKPFFYLEPYGAGTIRATTAGSCERVLVTCPFADIKGEVHQLRCQEDADHAMVTVTLPDVVSFLRGLSQETMDKLKTRFHYATLHENSLLYMPPGLLSYV
eukprot:6473785-Amphidinium_carterae.1